MNSLLFNREYIAEYYNCSGRTYEEWNTLGQQSPLLGLVFIFFGFVYLTMLLPFMVVLVKSDLMKYSCYKIMFFIGISDCFQIPIGGFYCGYSMIIGMVYCMSPTSNYIIGNLSIASWCSSSTACMFLAINRCVDVVSPNLRRKLFSGKKTLVWLLIPITYSFYCFYFHTTITFNSAMVGFFFDPFVGTPERNGTVDSEHYPHMVQSVHNVIVVVVLFVAYAFLIIYFFVKTAKSEDSVRMSKVQRQLLMQCCLICIGTFFSSLVYVYMQFIPPPVWLIICAHIGWQFSQGAAGISYAFFNSTMKTEFLKIFCSKFGAVPTVTIVENIHIRKLCFHK